MVGGAVERSNFRQLIEISCSHANWAVPAYKDTHPCVELYY